MKVEIKAKGVEPYTIDVLKMADRLNDIAERLNVVHLAIEGAAAELDTPLLGPVMTFVSEIRGQNHRRRKRTCTTARRAQ
jgi:hypothetical protein